MSSQSPFYEQRNAEYLGAAVAWVRARLESLAAEVAPPRSRRRRSCWAWLFRRSADPQEPRVDPQAEPQAFEAMKAACDQLAAAGEQPPMPLLLAQRFGFEHEPLALEVLLFCAAAELDTRVSWLCARAQDDPHRAYPTFALAARLFGTHDWHSQLLDSPLRRWRLIEVTRPPGTPLIFANLRLDERILHLLKRPGTINHLDDRLATLVQPVPPRSWAWDALPPSQESLALGIAEQCRSQDLVVLLLGADPPSKLRVAARAAQRLDQRLLRLPLERLPASPEELDLLSALWGRESRLLNQVLYLDADDDVGLGGGEGLAALRTAALNRFLARTHGLVFVAAREAGPRLGRRLIPVDVDKPTPPEQEQLWIEALGSECDGDEVLDIAGELAGNFHLDEDTIRQASARACVHGDATRLRDRLWSECRTLTRPRVDGLAQPIASAAAWEDLVLPTAVRDQLQALIAQVRHRRQVYDAWGFRARLNRGLGISALFSGSSGTGKTMAAEVIASELGLTLYRIDLSAVVSKFIGETEKNLRRVFDAFDDGGAVLLIDEADALFGKRTDVKDSHDRFANIEVSYLLQRLEAYRGLAILATNNRGAVDTAFLRRLRFVVNFPFPSTALRKQIWLKLLPCEPESGRPPTSQLDYDFLARCDLSGGNCLTVALNATFRAAARQADAVAMEDLLPAIEAELRKLNRPMQSMDYEPHGSLRYAADLEEDVA